MSEPSIRVDREKTVEQIQAQHARLLRVLKGPENAARRAAVNRAYLNYMQNISSTQEYKELADEYRRDRDRYDTLRFQPVGSNHAESMSEFREAQEDMQASRWAMQNYPYRRSVYARRNNRR